MKKKITLLKAIFLLSFLVAGMNVNAQAPDWLWARVAGDNSYNEAYSVATDESGNVYVAGYYNIYIYDLPHASGTDAFFVKYTSAGDIVWTRALSTSGTDRIYSIATDRLGHVYILGTFTGPSLIFCNDTLTNTATNKYDLFIAKYDSDGNCLWAKLAGGTNQEYATGMAVDSLGNAYVTGFFDSPTLSFGSHVLTNSGGADLYIAKYAPDGTELWAKSATGTAQDYSYSIAIDKMGNAFIAGDFNSGTLAFDAQVVTQQGNQDMFVAKYSSSGNAIWALSADGTSDSYGNGVAVDMFSNCYVAGSFRNSVTFDTTTLTSNGNQDILLVKYASDGSFVWVRSAGGTANDEAVSVATDSLGYCYVAGLFNSASITLGSFPLTNNGSASQDIYTAEYTANGDVVWAKSIGGLTGDYPNDIQPDLNRDVYVVGSLGSVSITIGDSTFYNAGSSNVLIAKSGNFVPTGITTFNNSFDISVYPNPADEIITINLPKNSTVEILDMQGRICSKLIATDNRINANLQGLQSGVYLVRVINDNSIAVGKLIKN